jgi:hypothetical protein
LITIRNLSPPPFSSSATTETKQIYSKMNERERNKKREKRNSRERHQPGPGGIFQPALNLFFFSSLLVRFKMEQE